MPHAVRLIFTLGLSFAAILIVLSQCRKPAWWPGRLFLWMMNLTHRGVTKWGLAHAAIGNQFTILDVGCGGGKTLQTLSSIAHDGKVCGVDYSAASVAVARRKNAAAIAAGRVDIREASVSHLPFTDNTFDLVSAVETHYYWPDPVNDVREIVRVLKPGGTLILIAETYKGEKLGAFLAVPMRLLRARYLTVDEHRQLLADAGCADVSVDVQRRKGWICCTGRKPVAP